MQHINSPFTPPDYVAPTGVSNAVGWNVVVIIIGSVIAAIGLLGWGWFFASAGQTVAVLWLIVALLGLLIAAAGVLGATIVHTLERRVRAAQ